MAVLVLSACGGKGESIPKSSFVGPYEGTYEETGIGAPLMYVPTGWVRAELSTGAAPDEYTIHVMTLAEALQDKMLSEPPDAPGPAVAVEDCTISIKRTGANRAVNAHEATCYVHYGASSSNIVGELTITKADVTEDKDGLTIVLGGKIDDQMAARTSGIKPGPYGFTLKATRFTNDAPPPAEQRTMVGPTVRYLEPRLASPEAKAFVNAVLTRLESESSSRYLQLSPVRPADWKALGKAGAILQGHEGMLWVKAEELAAPFFAAGATFVPSSVGDDVGKISVSYTATMSATKYTIGKKAWPGLDLEFDVVATVANGPEKLEVHVAVPSPDPATLAGVSSDYDLYQGIVTNARIAVYKAIAGMFFKP